MATFEEISSKESTSTAPISFLPEVVALTSEIVANRRWFHAHPELSFQEHKTAAKVVEILKSYGITEIFEGIGRTGVIAILRGNGPGPCIALRADMDALPLQETAEIDYRSQNENVMHACGHDGHISSLLAAAKILNAERDKFSGVVKLIFQPAEEGYGGAKEMMNDGCLKDGPFGPEVDSIYGIHLWSCKIPLKIMLYWFLPFD
jgi:amidohydrolase